MIATEQAWLTDAPVTDRSPGEPLVPSGVRYASPFALASELDRELQLSVMLGNRHLSRRVTSPWDRSGALAMDPKSFLLRLDDVLLKEGPVVAQAQWTSVFGGPSNVSDEIGRVRVSIGRWTPSGTEKIAELPNVIGMTPADARVYLTTIGKLEGPLPISVARALLAPRFSFGTSLAGLAEHRAHASLACSLIGLNDAHQLELRGEEPNAQRIVLASGWRSRQADVFAGYPNEDRYSHGHAECDANWPLDHDGSRLVRTGSPGSRATSDDAADEDYLLLPVVPLAEIADDVSRLLNEVAASPATMLQADVRSQMWRTRHSDVSPVAVRLVEGVLQQYVPWPFPFKLRRAGEQQVSQETTWNAVVRAFKRLLVASIDTEPPDVAAHFLALIGQGRAPLSVWPIPLEGVWGFKIRTGDHEWLKGTLWMEPDVVDNLSAALVFKESGKRIECGAARCAIQKSHY